jgi:lactoylglutathione lyase
MFLRIDCVMFRVEEIDPALAFYRDVVGLVPRWREGNMAGLEFPHAPGTELVLHTDPNIPAFDVNYAIEDVAAALPRLTEAGCRRHRSAEERTANGQRTLGRIASRRAAAG